jgi:hypothetical protein
MLSPPEVAGKEEAQRTRSKEPLEDIKKPKDLYGRDGNREPRAISYPAAAKLFRKVDSWVVLAARLEPRGVARRHHCAVHW